eukprot:4669706-Pyramimonas_sp.AAC.1
MRVCWVPSASCCGSIAREFQYGMHMFFSWSGNSGWDIRHHIKSGKMRGRESPFLRSLASVLHVAS